MSIHHATQKKAAALGIEIVEIDGEFKAIYEGYFILADTAKDAVAQMAQAIADETVEELDLVEDGEDGEDGAEGGLDEEEFQESADEIMRGEDEDEDEGAEGGRSIVKKVYRVRYKPTDNTNGDAIAQELREYLETEKDDGTPGIDRERLAAFAKANGFWDEKYTRLNNGQVRMNVGNKLRAKLRKNPDWQPVWP